MMTMNKFPFYWQTNHEWFDTDENGRDYLTDKAPKKAIESFKAYKELEEKKRKISHFITNHKVGFYFTRKDVLLKTKTRYLGV